MTTITREQAQKIIEAADEVISALAGTNEDVNPGSDNMLRLWDDLNDRHAPLKLCVSWHELHWHRWKQNRWFTCGIAKEKILMPLGIIGLSI